MANSQDLIQHIQLPESKRDLNWEKNFLKLFPSGYITLLSDAPENGSDGFPYLLAEIRPDSTEPVSKVIDWLAPRGIGLVVNPTKVYPDYIFTYGMLWNFALRGEFMTDNPIQADKTLVIEPGSKIIAGAPHEQYLPTGVRSILRQFFLDQGIFSPRVLVVGQNQSNSFSHYDLCFSLESLGTPSQSEHEGILKTLSWFLPTHYSLALMSESDLNGFVTL